MEIWKPVVTFGLEKFYEVSSLGNVKSLIRSGKTNFGIRMYGGKKINPFVSNSGYLCVNLTYKGFRAQCTVHTLVLEAFVGKKPEGMECCHNDGNRLNANLDNLRWDTKKNNHADKKIHGTNQAGSKNPSSKLTEEQAFFIKHSKLSPKDLCERYGVSRGCIEKIRHGINWKHI
jgi:hypothetical protein